jgi:RIO-like serine/threonine protein kinase
MHMSENEFQKKIQDLPQFNEELYNRLHNSKKYGYNWLDIYNKYHIHDPRVIKVLRIEDDVVVMEKLTGFTLDDTQKLRQLSIEQRRYIVNEVMDIYNKQFQFKNSILGPRDIWAHGDFFLQNLMYSDGQVRLIDPESFGKRSLELQETNMRYGKFFETLTKLMCFLNESYGD